MTKQLTCVYVHYSIFSGNANCSMPLPRALMPQSISTNTSTKMVQQHNGFSFDLRPNSGNPLTQPQRFHNQRRNQHYQPIDGDGLSTPSVLTGPMYPSLPAKYDLQCNRRQSVNQVRTSNYSQQHKNDQRSMARSRSFSSNNTNSLPTNDTSSKPNTTEDIINEFSDRMDTWRKKRNHLRTKTMSETLAATSISTSELNTSSQSGELGPDVSNANNSKEVSTIIVTICMVSQQ